VASIERRLKRLGAQTSLDPRGKQKGSRRLRVISDERTAMRLMGYDPGFIAKHAGGAHNESRRSY
jgi:hypothetical protein